MNIRLIICKDCIVSNYEAEENFRQQNILVTGILIFYKIYIKNK